MPVVSDSGPLIALARIGQLELLPKLYDEVIIPVAVQSELMAHPQRAGATILSRAVWLSTQSVVDEAEVHRLQFWLDRGESQAIVLAHELGVTLLIDERRGRAIASSLGLRVTGTLGVLVASKQTGLIDEVTPLLDALIESGIYISERLYREIRRLTGEG